MTFHNSARSAVLDAASALVQKSREIGIMRSVDATESARWLEEVAKQLRDACLEESDMASLREGEGGAKCLCGERTEYDQAFCPLHDAESPATSFVVGGYPPDPCPALLSLRIRDNPDTHRLLEQIRGLPNVMARGGSMTVFIAGEWVGSRKEAVDENLPQHTFRSTKSQRIEE